MAAPDRRLPFAFVDALDAPTLGAEDRHHLERVRRLRDGAGLTVGDGRGAFRLVRFGAELAVAGDVQVAGRAEPPVTIAFALTKGGKPELVVQKLVEVGVDRIVPFFAGRTVVRWEPAKAARNAERWQVIAREAAAQAHRPHLPVVDPVATFADAARLPGAALAHPDGPPLGARHLTVLIGPEGGWAPEEEATVPLRVAVGPHVMRAETAAIVAGALAVWTRASKTAERG